MSELAIKKQLPMSVNAAIEKVTPALQSVGFGILTRIDFDEKIKEKLNETIARTVILGACNPKVALEAFKQSTDVALLIPCNVVVRETGTNQCVVEIIRPSQMLGVLKDVKKSDLICKAEADLEKVVAAL